MYVIDPTIESYYDFEVGDTIKFVNINSSNRYIIKGFSKQLHPMIFLLQNIDYDIQNMWYYAHTHLFTVVEKSKNVVIYDDPEYSELFE